MSDDRKPHEDEPGRPALQGWGAAWRPPASLRDDTLRAARARGLVGGRTVNRWILWVGAAAAAVLLFVAGFGLGSQRKPGAQEETNVSGTKAAPGGEASGPQAQAGPRYAIFLFEDARYQTAPKDEYRARVREYSNWARDLAKAGRFVDGEKLSDDGSFFQLENGDYAPSASPMKDAARGMLVGYFVVGGSNLEDVVAVARNCPHLKYGGTLEVRPIEGHGAPPAAARSAG